MRFIRQTPSASNWVERPRSRGRRESRPEGRESWQVAQLACGTAALRYETETGAWLVLFDLVGAHAGSLLSEPVMRLPEGARWSRVLSSEETRFGGSGECAIDTFCSSAQFRRPETIVLRAESP